MPHMRWIQAQIQAKCDPMAAVIGQMDDAAAIASPEAITSMFNNVENNGAPWAFPATDRGKWADELASES